MVTGAGAGPRAGRLRRERALGPSAALDMALRRRPALALLLLLRGEYAGLRRARPDGSGRSGGRARGFGSGRCGGSWVQGGESRGCGGPVHVRGQGCGGPGVREGRGAAPKVRGPQRCGPRVGVGGAGRGRGVGVGGPRGRESWRSGGLGAERPGVRGPARGPWPCAPSLLEQSRPVPGPLCPAGAQPCSPPWSGPGAARTGRWSVLPPPSPPPTPPTPGWRPRAAGRRDHTLGAVGAR